MNIIMLRLIMVAALSQLVDRVMQAAQWGSAAGARGVGICGPVFTHSDDKITPLKSAV